MRRSMAVRLASVTVCAAVGLLLTALSARPVGAQGNLWAAIAVSPSTRTTGTSHAQASQADAERLALHACQLNGAKDCKVVNSAVNGCAALAMTMTMHPYSYFNGSGPTREGAAANALAECTKAGGNDCFVEQSPCSSDYPTWYTPLPLPSGGHPGWVDPALVGLWKLNVSSGIWVWQISANGTYTFHSESSDNTEPNAGQFAANNGHYTLHAFTEQWDDLGTYTLQGSTAVSMTGKLGTGTWVRIAADPGYPAPASGPGLGPILAPTSRH